MKLTLCRGHGNNDNSEIVDSGAKKKKGHASRTPPKKGNPSDSSDDSLASIYKKRSGSARPSRKKRHIPSDSSDDSSSPKSSYYDHKSTYKDQSASSDTEYRSHKHKMNRRFKRSTWNETTGTSIQMFAANQIHPNSPDKFYRLRQKHALLNGIGLLTLVQGYRKRLILNKHKNRHGYKKSKIIHTNHLHQVN